MKILTLLFLCFAFGAYAQIDYLPPHLAKDKAKLSQLIDSSGSCKIGSFRLYYTSEGQDLQIIENKGDAFNPQIVKMLKYAKVGDIFRFVRIKNAKCEGITDTFTLHIQASKPPRMLTAAKMQEMNSLDELFAALPHKKWQSGCKVKKYALYYTKLRQDPIEIVASGNNFEGDVKIAVASAKKGDCYIFLIQEADCQPFSITIHIE